MAHTSSAKKRLRQNEKRRLRNRATKKAIKTQIKRVLTACDQGDLEKLRQEYNSVAQQLDKAAARRIVHPNLAARKKSQLARMVHQKEVDTKAAPAGQ
jgi:small subunit ribosomal protein S20